jgi:single-stranded DNA-binding protein
MRLCSTYRTQQANSEVNIPIRIVGRKAQAVLNRIKEGTPIMVEGILRRKVYPRDDDPTMIASSHTYIETVTGVAIAKYGQDMLSIPSWVAQIRQRLLERAEQAKARRAALHQAQQEERGKQKPSTTESEWVELDSL